MSKKYVFLKIIYTIQRKSNSKFFQGNKWISFISIGTLQIISLAIFKKSKRWWYLALLYVKLEFKVICIGKASNKYDKMTRKFGFRH